MPLLVTHVSSSRLLSSVRRPGREPVATYRSRPARVDGAGGDGAASPHARTARRYRPWRDQGPGCGRRPGRPAARPRPLAKLVADALALDPQAVRVDNDVNAATLAEHRLGAGQGFDDLLAVFAGTGVGGALVLDGRLRRGFRSAAGELGHAVVVEGGDECPCGRRGCTEAYVGRATMERAVRAAVGAGRTTLLPAVQQRLGRARLTTDVLAEGLALGDALAAELVERAARALGAAIASAANLLDVPAVLLGGGLTDGLGEPFVRQVEAAVRPHLFVDEPPLEIRPTALGDLAGAIGAALLLHETPSSP